MNVDVVLPIPVEQPFTYSVPPELENATSVGVRVRVRLHNKEKWGIVVHVHRGDRPNPELEPVLDVRPTPAFSEASLGFGRWVCDEYLAPLGMLVNRVLPFSAHARTMRIVTLADDLPAVLEYVTSRKRRAPRQVAVLRSLLAAEAPLTTTALARDLGPIGRPLDRLIEMGLVCEVEEAPPPIAPSFKRLDGFPRTGRVLLFSHDRWSTYANLVTAALAAGQRALILAPQILLAARLQAYLQDRLNVDVDLYHSALPDAERGAVWERVRTGTARLVVGTRSAVFLPIESPSLVVVDEEHDPSFKQSDMLPYYHVRRAAVRKGELGLVVFGSAAPSLEARHAAAQKQLAVVRPPDERPPRAWRIVDLRGETSVLGRTVIEEIGRSLDARDRVLIGVISKGTTRAAFCATCRRSIRCPRCGGPLVYHRQRSRLACATCKATPDPVRCGHCWGEEVQLIDGGGSSVYEEVRARFPDVHVHQVDSDRVRTAGSAAALRRAMDETADVLIGTAMIAVGPALPGVRLVVAAETDLLLATPDFRAEERAYQYLVGLAGRSERGGILVQTRVPDHPLLRIVCEQDDEAFYAREISQREAFFYPPFSRLARVTISQRDRAHRRAEIERVCSILGPHSVDVLGPSPHPRYANRSILLLKSASRRTLLAVCRKIRDAGIPAMIDLDPDRL